MRAVARAEGAEPGFVVEVGASFTRRAGKGLSAGGPPLGPPEDPLSEISLSSRKP